MQCRLTVTFCLFLFVLVFSSAAKSDTPIIADTTLIGTITDLPVVIEANNITLDCDNNGLNGPGFGDAVVIQNKTGVTVKDCNISDVDDGFNIDSARKLVITDNNISEANDDAFDLENVQGSYFIDNSVNLVNGQAFDLDTRSNNNTFINNRILNIGGPAFDLDDCHYNRFENNVIEDTGSECFDLDNSHNNTFVSNSGEECADAGFDITNSRSNFFVGNTLSNNDDDGFTIREGSYSNTFLHNIVQNNIIHGFQVLSGAQGNTFEDNNCFFNSGFGMRDFSIGNRTSGTANTYKNNDCNGNGSGDSDPSGLCD